MKRNIVSRTLAGMAAAAISLGCFALGAGTAQAADTDPNDATITLSGEVAGHTFKAYQLATYEKVKSDGTDITSMELATVGAKADLIKTTAEAVATEAGGVGADKTTALPAAYTGNPAGWLSSWTGADGTNDSTAVRLFTEKYVASDDLGDPSATVTGAEGADSAVFDFGNVAANAGWFVITDTNANGAQLGSPILVGSTWTGKVSLNGVDLGEATVKPSETDTVAAPTKTADKTSVSVVSSAPAKGDANWITYTLTGVLPKNATAGYTYKFVDVPQKGLTVTPSGFTAQIQSVDENGKLKVDADGNPVYENLSATYVTAPRRQVVGDGAKTFEIALKNVEKLTPGATVKVTYQGYVTAEPEYNEAGVGEVSNAAHIEYGAAAASASTQSAEAAAATTVKSTESAAAAVKVFKGGQFTKIGADTKKALAGATFSLKLKDSASTTALRTVTSGENGVVAFTGLGAGTYVVTETNVPDGYYSEIKPSFEMTVNDNGTIVFGKDATWDLVNNADQANVTVTNVNKVTQLPSTGGMGLGVITAAIVLAAGGSVFFAAKTIRNRRAARM